MASKQAKRIGGRTKTFRLNNFRGGVNTVVEETGYFMIAHGTSIYRFDGTTKTSIGMTIANAFVHFETAFDALIVCDGTGNPQKWAGTTVANLSTGDDATAIAGAKQL